MIFGRKKRREAAERRRTNDHLRAEGLEIASQLLGQLAGSVKESPREDLHKGLLCAAGFTSVMASALRSGGSEIGFVDLGDGDTFPVDLTMRVNEQ
jgi:hypothetical protein